jgi:hypothetical protein
MTSESTTIAQHLWNYCNVLHDDNVSYGDEPASVLLERLQREKKRKGKRHSSLSRLGGGRCLSHTQTARG